MSDTFVKETMEQTYDRWREGYLKDRLGYRLHTRNPTNKEVKKILNGLKVCIRELENTASKEILEIQKNCQHKHFFRGQTKDEQQAGYIISYCEKCGVSIDPFRDPVEPIYYEGYN